MGCGASKAPEEESQKKNTKYEYDDDDEEESDAETRSVTSQSSRTSNKFTAEYTGGRGRKGRGESKPEYSPLSRGDNFDKGFEAWKQQALKGLGQKTIVEEPEQSVEDFVFGDFKVDPGDVQKQRQERINRHRKTSVVIRKASIKETSEGDKKEVFGFGDFSVPTVDDIDDRKDPELEEISVPIGFTRIKHCRMRSLLGHTSRVKAIAVAPNEVEFASASMEDNGIGLVNMETGEEGVSFVGHVKPIIAATFSKDGRYLATSSRDNSVIIWDTTNKDMGKKQIRSLDHASLPICCTFSHDGKCMVTGCQDRTCCVWDIHNNCIQTTYSEHEAVVVSIACVPTSEHAISGGGDRIIHMWNIETGETVRQFIGHDGVVISISITGDGERFLSNDDRACKMWNIETGACILNVTLDSLTGANRQPAQRGFTPPIPLTKNFLDKCPLQAKQFGQAPHGILGPQASNACKIGTQRAVFTLSCLCPGTLSRSYFAVASTNKVVYIVSCASGKEEYRFVAKAAVFALAPGRKEKLLFGDIFGNIYNASVEAEQEQQRTKKR